jgi:polysaccharide pyruvyl transferase WcaK-like protein
LRRAAFITARDRETFDDLAAWRLPCPIEHTADVAFLLEAAPAADAEDRLRALGGWDPSRPVLGITPSNLYNVRAAGRTGTAADPAAPIGALAEASRRLIEETNAQLLLIPHVFGPGREYDDRRACTALAERLAPGIKPLVVSDALAPAQLKALIGRCDVYVSMRMHSVIAATSQAVPTLAVAYSPKLGALMARLGMERFVLDCTRLDRGDLVEPLQRLWAERESVRDALRQVMEKDILPQAARNFDILARMIESAPAPQNGNTDFGN